MFNLMIDTLNGILPLHLHPIGLHQSFQIILGKNRPPHFILRRVNSKILSGPKICFLQDCFEKIELLKDHSFQN